MIVIQALIFISEFYQELQHSQSLFDQVLQYIFSKMEQNQLRQKAVQSFSELVDNFNKHNFYSSFTNLFNLFNLIFCKLENSKQLSELIQHITQFILNADIGEENLS